MVFWAGVMLVGCGGNDAGKAEVRAAQVAGINSEGCKSEKGTAVSISFAHPNGEMSDDVKVEYRKNGGDWTVLEEHARGAVFIQDTAGTYEIKAIEKGYVMESALVIVPSDSDCGVLKQEVGFIFTPAICSDVIPIVINVVKPIIPENLILSVHPPGQEKISLPCPLGRCYFNLTPSEDGIYEIGFSDFPNYKEPRLSGADIIRYAYVPVEVLVSVDDRKHHVVSEAVDRLDLNIPYDVGESGCYEVDLEGVTAEVTPIGGIGGIHAGPIFHIYPLTNEQCQQQSQEKEISFVLEVPTGTALNDVKVEYLVGNDTWEQANCVFDRELVCTAKIDNPFKEDEYRVRTTINKKEDLASYISLWDKCIVFD